MNAAIAPATKTVYGNAIKAFQSFINDFYPGTQIETCSLDILLMFISFVYQNGRSANTVNTYMGALSFVFKIQGISDLTSHCLIKKMLCGARRLSASPDMRRPITLPVLKQLLDALPFVTYSFDQQQLFSAMLLLAFHVFLRIGEITVRSKDNVNLIILKKKITFDHLQSDQQFIVLRMTNFKHNASKQAVTLQIQSKKNV